jgi:hemin uptake protein HemP
MCEKPEKAIPASAAPDETNQTESTLEIDTRELLGVRREATILHAGKRYRLRITSNNKLILTK